MCELSGAQSAAENLRAMVGKRMTLADQHREAAAALLRLADDPSCDHDGMEPDELEDHVCDDEWERSEYIAAAQAHATLSLAMAQATAALVGIEANNLEHDRQRG